MELVERRLKEVDQLQGLDDAARTELRSIYQEALHELTSARDLAAQAKSLAEMAAAADENLQEAQLEVSRTPAAVQIELPPDATLAKLEELVSAEEKKLDAAKQRKEKLDLEVGRRQGRRAEIPGRVQQLQDARKDLEAESNSLPAGGGPRRKRCRLVLPRGVWPSTRKFNWSSRSWRRTLPPPTCCRWSVTWQVARCPWPRNAWPRGGKQWKTDALRKSSVRRKRPASKRRRPPHRSARWPTAVAELAKRSSELLEKIQLVNGELDGTRSLLEKTQQQSKLTTDKVERVGLNYAIGLLLRKERGDFPMSAGIAV